MEQRSAHPANFDAGKGKCSLNSRENGLGRPSASKLLRGFYGASPKTRSKLHPKWALPKGRVPLKFLRGGRKAKDRFLASPWELLMLLSVGSVCAIEFPRLLSYKNINILYKYKTAY